MLAATTGDEFLSAKGIVVATIRTVAPKLEFSVEPAQFTLLDAARQCRLVSGGKQLAVVGELSQVGRDQFELRGPATVFELDLETVIAAAQLRTTVTPLSPYPPVGRDINVVVDEAIRWETVESAARAAGGDLVEAISYQGDYRDASRLGPGKKSLLFGVLLRSPAATLTNEEADAVRERIVAKLATAVGASLRA